MTARIATTVTNKNLRRDFRHLLGRGERHGRVVQTLDHLSNYARKKRIGVAVGAPNPQSLGSDVLSSEATNPVQWVRLRTKEQYPAE